MNLNLRSVQSKITLGFGLILLVVAVLSFAIVSGIRKINNVNEQLSTSFGDMEKNLISLNSNVKESIVLTKNWVYQPNAQEKDKLTNFISTDSKRLLSKLDSFKPLLSGDHREELIDKISGTISKCFSIEMQVTDILKTSEDYNMDSTIDSSISLLKELEERFADYNSGLDLLNNYFFYLYRFLVTNL